MLQHLSDTSRLTIDEIDHYNREGYILYHKPVFSPEKFARLSSIFEELLAERGEDNLDVVHFYEPRLLEFLMSDEVLDLVEPVVGPNIGLWSSHFISKAPRTGKATPWHEDSAYWNGRVSTMARICTVWLALDVVNEENGCMRVIPGSHANGFSNYVDVDTSANIFGTEIDPASIDESKAVYFELQPNECSLHEARIIHGAKANTSDRRRAGYTMRYFPTTSLVYPEKNPNHKIWLARGKDFAGNKYEN